MDSKDGRAVARENEVQILRALHRFGWLRTRDLAGLIWQRWADKPVASEPSLERQSSRAGAIRMAQRTLKRLHKRHLVLSALAPDGSTIYALAEGGARALRRLGIAASTGKDLVRSFSAAHYRHRCIANEIAITGIVQGYRASTEREIAQGLWLGGERGIQGKRPDVLLRNGAEECWWIEVERSRKNSRDYASLLDWLQRVLRDASAPAGSTLLGARRWAKVIFICTAPFRKKLLRDLEGKGVQKNQILRVVWFETELYRMEDIAFG